MCRRYCFYVVPFVYQVIAYSVKTIECVSLTLKYFFEIIVCEKGISLGSCRKIILYLRYCYFLGGIL